MARNFIKLEKGRSAKEQLKEKILSGEIPFIKLPFEAKSFSCTKNSHLIPNHMKKQNNISEKNTKKDAKSHTSGVIRKIIAKKENEESARDI